jgi:hypothetical protein
MERVSSLREAFLMRKGRERFQGILQVGPRLCGLPPAPLHRRTAACGKALKRAPPSSRLRRPLMPPPATPPPPSPPIPARASRSTS